MTSCYVKLFDRRYASKVIAMKKIYTLLFLLALFMCACASPKEEGNTASQQASANANANTSTAASNPQQPINVPSANVGSLPSPTPQNGTPAVQPVPLPESAKVTENPPNVEVTGPAPKL